MKTNSQTKCADCGATYSFVVKGKRDYFIPWGSYFLCDKCHRFAIMKALKAEFEPPVESPK